MDLLEKLERKFRWISIENLPLYIVATQGLLYLWLLLNPGQIVQLVLNPYSVMVKHEYWRLFTFLFITKFHGGAVSLFSILFAVIWFYVLYMIGTSLESEWGSFRFTLYYVLGVLGTVGAALLFGSRAGAFYLNTTLFLAFAALNPNFEFLLYFIIPVKIKWLAWLTWAYFAFIFLMGSLSDKAALFVSLINYFLFFGGTHINNIKAMIRREKFKRQIRDD